MTASRRSAADRIAPFALAPVAAIAAALAVVLTALSGRYGFHRDELYFLVAGKHLAWGFTDQPPLTPLLAHLSTAIFGNTPMGLRVLSTLTAAATVVVVALISRELGSDRRAQTFAAFCAAIAGFPLGVGHLASTATYDLLAWMVIGLFAVKLLRTGDDRWWVAIGLATGIALENKYLVVLPLAALLLAVLIVGPRSVLRSWWLVAGIITAALVAVPNLWWQATNGWPQFTVARGISGDDGVENRIMFIPLQLLQLSPLLVPIWVAGFLRIWRSPWARPVALAYPILCIIVVAVGGKPYYALPLLLILVAGGVTPTLDWLTRGRRRLLLVAGALVATVSSAIIALPILPTSAINAVLPINPEQGEQIGWPALTSAVAEAWQQLPSPERSRATIFALNYGEAGAIDYYGPAHNLPTPYSGHMSFHAWGPPPDTQSGPVLLVEQEPTPYYESRFGTCHQLAIVNTGHSVDNEEQGTLITLCTGPTQPWSTLWPSLRRYY